MFCFVSETRTTIGIISIGIGSLGCFKFRVSTGKLFGVSCQSFIVFIKVTAGLDNIS